MSDTPIAERLAAELGMPWPLSWQHMHGTIFDFFEPLAGSEDGDGGSPNGCGPLVPGPHPPSSGEIDG